MRTLLSSLFLRFLALSVAIHALMLGEWVEVHRAETSAATVLTAELVTRPRPDASVAKPAPAYPQPPQAVARAPQPPRPISTPDPAAISVPRLAVEPEPEAESPEPEMIAADAPESTPETASAAETPAEPVIPSQEVAAQPRAPVQPVRDLPSSGSQSYELFMGRSRLHIGRTLQTWTIDGQTYRLSSSSETTGLAGFFRPYQLDYVSEGRVDATGFQPESFSVRRGRSGSRQYAVRFDWSAKELTLGPVSAPRKMPLPEGTLDVLTFIYQLVRAQLTPGRFQLHITTGNRLDIYTLDVGVEEEIEVPTGTLRALPIRQVRKEGQESMEIWLAPERDYLPVLIRFLDKNGELSGEQLAADIAFNAR